MAMAPVGRGASGYCYAGLDTSVRQIRLLKLKRGRMGDPVACSLETISLDTQPVPVYYALSYVWGSAAKLRHMMLDNHAFPITANLHTALCFMRGSESDVLVWTDAVCINQDDLDERGRQVALMEDIYTAAKTCACWLGSADGQGIVSPGGIFDLHERMPGLDWKDSKAPVQAYWYFLEELSGPDKLRPHQPDPTGCAVARIAAAVALLYYLAIQTETRHLGILQILDPDKASALPDWSRPLGDAFDALESILGMDACVDSAGSCPSLKGHFSLLPPCH